MPGTINDPLYPEIEPFDSGHIAVGQGHEIYYEKCGNPSGKPVLFLHGGPGAGSNPKSRRFFDPETYMIVVIDQRGCNRSKPNAADDLAAALKHNNTQTLVEDCEVVRKHCGVTGPWAIVLGGSWGSTLALAYAITYPEAMSALVLRGVFTGEQSDIDHAFNSGSMMQHHPEAWEDFAGHIKETASSPEEAARESEHILAAYNRRLNSSDRNVQYAAAKAFTRYELTVIKNDTPKAMIEDFCNTPSLLVPFASFEVHFMLNHVFLREGEILDGCAKLPKNMRVRIINGRCDFICRPVTAWRLYKTLKANGLEDVQINLVNGWGHHDSEEPVGAAMVQATDELRK
eukprot:TRINITY_DN63859_c0_g1_i1.p1 TRINITY_DN63859_c0_g1~~TRINITY_DN63859_c0_g1_i1.p1  ORF type:complete len:344 (-),score=89.85 TRINITY_DN63859_c0_g1_i1:115-1146(-)